MKKISALLMVLGLTFAVAGPAMAESLWCDIKHNYCDTGHDNPVCITARANCPN
ncbi:hypothetical protein SAMN02745857_04218 [Andreprevotia lacus DSM 23236]|uniref:Uncharacterized protein n=1 Tax=Andreprevotia lacus DSM 23236 TaxID=1121001 RepID=A0A1W1Y142_9NEIS|nr:hypothetical protein [Andreprevotia lacus]SMC29876.1 hypothetical protein SAMN02745857_04218 [Andreprevotia lacus DSM 23236]